MNAPNSNPEYRHEPLRIVFDEIDSHSAEVAESDQVALDRILMSLRNERDAKIDEKPLEALAYAVLVESAESVRRAGRVVRQVQRENQETASRRAEAERRKSIDGLEQRLLKSPLTALAEAAATSAGCRRAAELWRCLGESLKTREGWNDEENRLAWALLGSTTPGVRSSRERSRLGRSLEEDCRRPSEEIHEVVEKGMNGYVKNLLKGLDELSGGDRSLHSAILEFVEEKAAELRAMLDPGDRAEVERIRDEYAGSDIGRRVWASTRRFVAARILEWRRSLRRAEATEAAQVSEGSFESYGPGEMKKAEWARKGASATLADFQKSLALAKSLGLIEVPASRTAKGKKPEQVLTPMSVSGPGLERVVEMPSSLIEKPKKAACRQPRDKQGRFLSTKSSVSASLRPTSAGRNLMAAMISRYENARDKADGKACGSGGFEGQEEASIVSPSWESPGSATGAGTSIALAEFPENRQNEALSDDCRRPETYDEPRDRISDDFDASTGDDDR